MRKFTLSIVLLLTSFYTLLAAGPTVPSSNVTVPASAVEGNRFTVNFSKGNGASRIIVVKEGSAVNGLPVNGTEYTAGTFGNPSFAFAPNDGYVVYKGSTTQSTFSFQITNLQPGTTYHVAIFEYNGTGAATEYLMIGAIVQGTTKTAPTSQAAFTTITNVAGNRLTLNWTPGNGDKRLVLARKGAPVNAVPSNFTDYSHSTSFGSGNSINGDNYVVYDGQAASSNITNLEPNTTYHFAIFEYNGTNFPVYLSPANTTSRLTNTGPTQASGSISFSSIEGNRMTLSFGAGNGKHQLIVARQGQAPTFVPTNGQTYTANTAFQSGEQVAPGEYIVNTVNTDRTFTNLLPATLYYFRVYDYDVDLAGNTYYLTSAYSQSSRLTAVAPASSPSNVRFENVTGSSMTIRHDDPVSTYRLIVMKMGSPVDALPEDLERYNGNQAFLSGDQITPGNYVMSDGQNSYSLPVTGLTPGATYHVAVFGFNGNNYPVYNMTPARASITIPNQPTTAATNWQINSVEGNEFRGTWNGGNGANRIVIARKGAPVSVTPADGVTYDADPVFGDGDEIATGQFVVHNGTNRLVDMKGLEIGSTYHFAVFEYNGTGTNTDYLVSSFLTGTGTTLSAPTDQTDGLLASNIQNTQATINYSIGNGSGRIFLIRAGSPVNAEPTDLQSYSYSPTYGGLELGNTGNYIIYKTAGSSTFTASGLTANTQYHVTVFEYNGSNHPVYMRPGASFSFTTTGTGVAPPTTHASAPVFSIVDGNKLKFEWQQGDGARRIVVARQGSAVAFTPVNGTNYPDNASFASGNDLGGGQYVVYNGVSDEVTITSLLPSTTYHFAVFEYNGSGTTCTYLTTGALATSRSTAITPAAGSTNVNGTVSGTALNITWNSGPGAGRLVVVKEGNAVSGTPADLSKYPASAVFNNGSQVGAGEYVVYAGSGNSVTVTGLSGNKTYHYTVFEYNGVDAPLYNTVNAVSNSTHIPGSLPLTWLYFRATELSTGGVRLDWGTTNETNTSHFVVEKSESNGQFTAVGTIQAAGSGNDHDYTFTDPAVITGTVSYRIKQVDIDNRFTYSRQVVVKAAAQQAAIRLYPNPAPGYTRIGLPQGVQQALMQVYSMEGKLIKSKTVLNGEMLSLQELPKGIYTVVVSDKEMKSSARLVVQ